MDFYFALLLSRRVAKSKCLAKWKNCYVILINGEGTYFVSFFSAYLSFSFLYPFPAMSCTYAPQRGLSGLLSVLQSPWQKPVFEDSLRILQCTLVMESRQFVLNVPNKDAQFPGPN